MENLKNIIKEIQSYRKELDFHPTDNHILECSTRIFISQNISQESKMPKKTFLPNSPATKKQLYFLDKNEIKHPKDITKLEASKLIKEYKSK